MQINKYCKHIWLGFFVVLPLFVVLINYNSLVNSELQVVVRSFFFFYKMNLYVCILFLKKKKLVYSLSLVVCCCRLLARLIKKEILGRYFHKVAPNKFLIRFVLKLIVIFIFFSLR